MVFLHKKGSDGRRHGSKKLINICYLLLNNFFQFVRDFKVIERGWDQGWGWCVRLFSQNLILSEFTKNQIFFCLSFKLSNIQTYKHINMLNTNIQTYKHTNIQTCRHTNIPPSHSSQLSYFTWVPKSNLTFRHHRSVGWPRVSGPFGHQNPTVCSFASRWQLR